MTAVEAWAAAVYVTPHAIERLREHHPRAGWRGALGILSESTPVAAGEVAGFLRRALSACRDDYYLTRCRRGILVVAPSSRDGDRHLSLVTYLRLSPGQQDEAMRLWGPG